MFDQGAGKTIVVVQPLQGRWEWTRPLLVELARQAHVISYSLSGERGSRTRMDDEAGFDAFVAQLRDVMDAAGVRQAALCGISFGGAVAARFAAQYPERVSHLVIASSPGPGWRPNATQARYVARPWRSMPAFTVGALGRVVPEIASSLASWPSRVGFAARYGLIALRYPVMPHLMARRVRLLEQIDLASDCSRITAPTLVLTGERDLDRVVPLESTRRYVDLIPGARYVMIERTGHLGVLTQPRQFASLVSNFVNGDHS